MSNNLVTLDVSQLKYVTNVLKDVKNGLPRAIQGAINTSLTESRRDLYNAIKEEYNLQKTASRKKEALDIKRASPTQLFGRLFYKGRNIPLINFRVAPSKSVRRNPRNTRVISEIHRGQPQTWKSAFVAQMRSGYVGVYVRRGKAQYPITEKYSTSIPQMINYVLNNNPQLANKLQRNAEVKLNEQVDKILAKAGK